MSGTSSDDEAWAAIVANYGERAQVEESRTVAPESVPDPEPEPFAPTYDDVDRAVEREERFVPPDPGPAPRVVLPRDLPWVAVLGIPVVVLVCLLAGVSLPSWLGWLLVLGFVGGFVYLVARMQRGGRDPWDDGARV